MTTSIGIDIGGTKIAGGLVDEQGTLVASGRRRTNALDTQSIIEAVASLVDELSEAGSHGGRRPAGVGVACAGYIDADGENVLFAPNIAWRDEPLRAKLQARIDLPVVLENDANAATYGEFTHGGGRDYRSMVMLTLGTGVGGGIVVDGQLLRGAYGVAAELGHLRVVPDGQICGCGNHGCLEAYASGSALVREGRSLVTASRPTGSTLWERCGGDASLLTGPMITETAFAGDPASRALFTDIGHWVGEASASLAAVLDPEAFIIGGGVSEAGDLLLKPARESYITQLSGHGHHPVAVFALAELGNDAGMIGAAVLAAEAAA